MTSSTGIDTEVLGDPASVARAAAWLRQGLHDAVTDAADTLRDADPGEGWQGRSAEAYDQWRRSSAATTEKLGRRVQRAASDLADWAQALRAAERDMRDVVIRAREAGLTVSGHVVADPGAGPADPGRLPTPPPGTRLSAAGVARHAELVAAHEAHAELVRAYREAERAAASVRADLRRAADQLREGYDALRSLGWMTHGLGILPAGQDVSGPFHAAVGPDRGVVAPHAAQPTGPR